MDSLSMTIVVYQPPESRHLTLSLGFYPTVSGRDVSRFHYSQQILCLNNYCIYYYQGVRFDLLLPGSPIWSYSSLSRYIGTLPLTGLLLISSPAVLHVFLRLEVTVLSIPYRSIPILFTKRSTTSPSSLYHTCSKTRYWMTCYRRARIERHCVCSDTPH
jgi:hypothetical protein